MLSCAVCFRVGCLTNGLTLQKGVVGHVGGALLGRLRCPPGLEVRDECQDHLKRVAAVDMTRRPKRMPAAM